MKSLNMKKLIFSTLALTGFRAASLRAGTETYKQVAPPPPPPMYGLGFYGAIDAGANVYQNRGGSRDFTVDDPNSQFFGSDLHVNPKNDVGFFGGIKLGYVFGHGLVRPTIEGDFFYNGFRGGADFTLNEAFTPFPGAPTEFRTAQRNVTTWINTGTLAGELHFAIRAWKPKVPAVYRSRSKVGIYYAESAGVEVNDPVTGAVPINTGGGASHADLALMRLPVPLLFFAQVERVYRV